jgi:superfamily II DNA or RNA helicase
MFRDQGWKPIYRTGDDDLFNDFYSPALSQAVNYDRAVGFFSSEILSMALQGIGHLVESGGRMRLVIGQPLDQDEFEAVQQGITMSSLCDELTDKFISIIRESEGVLRNRLEILAWMIACDSLEIKFAFRQAGMYHEKIGIMYDGSGNVLVYQGSANETPHGMSVSLNAESIMVFPSWNKELFQAYGQPCQEAFEVLWQGKQKNTLTIKVPSELYQKVVNAIGSSSPPDIELEAVLAKQEGISGEIFSSTKEPTIPVAINGKEFSIFEHQKQALGAWRANSFKGILKLATGSGKTITSIYGAVKIYQARKRLFLVVAVPYVELALQWVDNLKIFGITPHKCFDSASSWKSRLSNAIKAFITGSSDFCAVVVVNKTLSSNEFSGLISKIPSDEVMIVGDECHNHGSKKNSENLPDAYYRMGLSATPFRSDEDEIDSPFPNEAKQRILEYYGSIVSEYSLSDAIHDGVLAEYNYNIVPVYLTCEEQEEYEELSLKIAKLILKKKSGSFSKDDQERLTQECGKRSRLIGSAKNKFSALRSLLGTVASEKRRFTLFYCGEGITVIDDREVRVIDHVSSILVDSDWKVSQFTSAENKAERKAIMSSFKDAAIEGLVAMKVLDEGIDVPVCETAFILASTKNPRQYVQRRGRILRKYPGKKISNIYDFVVLPEVGSDSSASKKLIASEYERVCDFALLASNKLEIEKDIGKYGLGYVENFG